jgi:5'(3')-deoxyribonucleotidase
MKPRLYLDMDGVLADFNRAAAELLGEPEQSQHQAAERGRWPQAQWQRISENPHFYRTLPKMPAADSLVDLATKFRDHLDYELCILTAIPRDNDMPDAFHDKLLWIQEHYADVNFRVYFGPYSHDKKHHCRQADDILVDDRTSNCTEWRAQGGTAIQVRANQYSQALEELQSLYHTILTCQMI